MIAAYGYESPQHWLVIDGARDSFTPVGEVPEGEPDSK
jgi:hypothetical protein